MTAGAIAAGWRIMRDTAIIEDVNAPGAWLEPVSLRVNRGYTPREVERLRRIVIANRELLLRSWDEFFDQPTG